MRIKQKFTNVLQLENMIQSFVDSSQKDDALSAKQASFGGLSNVDSPGSRGSVDMKQI